MSLEILSEDTKVLILGGHFKYPEFSAYYVNFINKETLEFRAGFVPDPKSKQVDPIFSEGQCLKK